MKNMVWTLLAAVSLVAGCSEGGEADSPVSTTRLSLSSRHLAFDASGRASGEAGESVVVGSSGAWRLSGRKGWCTPSGVSGGNGDEVRFTVDPNETLEPRTETFTFMCGEREERLTVTQEAGSHLSQEGDGLYEVADRGGEVRIRIGSSSEASYRFDEEVPWVRRIADAPATCGVTVSYLYFEVAPNTSGRLREAHLTLSNAEGDRLSATIRQAKNPILELVGEHAFEVPVEGGRFEVTLRSNMPFEVCPSEPWLRLVGDPVQSDDLQEQRLVFEAGASDDPFRTASVAISSSESPGLHPEISVVQGKRPEGVHFPDAKFRQILIDAGYVTPISGDECQITEKGRSATTLPDLYGKQIASLKGIEAFANIVDLGSNGAGNNAIRELDLSGNPKFEKLFYEMFGNKYSYLEPNPIERLVLGDAPVKDGYVYLAKFYDPQYTMFAESLSVSGSKVTTVEIASSDYDRVKSLDITGCPNIASVMLHSYYIGTLYVTRDQKEAIDAKRISIIDSNYPTSALKIVVRDPS